MRVEVINTGTEILLGNVINGHLAFLGRELFPLGLRIQRQIAVPDGEAIRKALAESSARAEIVIVTGGLGPTTDDITREITAQLLGVELVHDAAVMKAIEDRFAARGIKITDRVQRQAQVPKGAVVLQNENGTAPGLYFDLSKSEKFRQLSLAIRHLILLPGPPRELEPMFNQLVLPVLKKALPEGELPELRNYRIIGLGESNVEAMVGAQLLAIEGIELGYCARAGEVDLRVIGSKKVVESADEIVLKHLKSHIASMDNRSLEQVVVQRLAERGETISVAESCTGGFLANRITNVPGASKVFMDGYVTYANKAKIRALKIDPALIEKNGAVSEQVAVAMADSTRMLSFSDHALSTTGIAGPDGGTEEKPVGTVFIALASRNEPTVVKKHMFPTDRENFKWLVTQTALEMLRQRMA